MNAPHIGTLNEGPLHAALKAWYAQPGDQIESPVAGFVVDIVRGELLIEIQTAWGSGLKAKWQTLIETHPLRVVHPVAQETWLIKRHADREERRKSPKRGQPASVCAGLVHFPHLLAHPNFSLEVLLIQAEEVRVANPQGWRRHGWSIAERRLVRVVERHVFETPAALRRLLPEELASPFSATDLALAGKLPQRLAQQMCYCLRESGALEPAGKRGRARLYALTSTPDR